MMSEHIWMILNVFSWPNQPGSIAFFRPLEEPMIQQGYLEGLSQAQPSAKMYPLTTSIYS